MTKPRDASDVSPEDSLDGGTDDAPAPTVELAPAPLVASAQVDTKIPGRVDATNEPAALPETLAKTPAESLEVPRERYAPTPAEVDDLALSLGDPVIRASTPWLHYQAVLEELGVDATGALVREARRVEAQGGLTVEKGERKRTLGGVFFAVARERLGLTTWRAVRKIVRQREHAQPARPRPRPTRPEPEVVMVRRRTR